MGIEKAEPLLTPPQYSNSIRKPRLRSSYLKLNLIAVFAVHGDPYVLEF